MNLKHFAGLVSKKLMFSLFIQLLLIEKVEKKSSYKNLEIINNVFFASIFMEMAWLFLLNPKN